MMVDVFVYDTETGVIAQRLVCEEAGLAAALQPGQATITADGRCNDTSHHVNPKTRRLRKYPKRPDHPARWDGEKWVRRTSPVAL